MEIFSRAAWGARYRDGFGNRTLPATRDFQHHSVTASAGPNATLEQDCAKVRSLEYVGYVRFGGMSYTYVIAESGRVFQGHSIGRIGAHTAGYNTTGIGIALMGNYENLAFNAKQQAALVELLKYLRSKGYLAPAAVLTGHYQVKATACPGKNVKPLLPTIELLSRQAVTVPSKIGRWATAPVVMYKGPGTKYGALVSYRKDTGFGFIYKQPLTGWTKVYRGPEGSRVVGWVEGKYLTTTRPVNPR